MLKLLLDEMYSGLKEYFETLGWEALTVIDVGLQGAKDKDIVEYGEKNELLLVTQDQKTADLADLRGAKYVLISMREIVKIADARIREKYADQLRLREGAQWTRLLGFSPVSLLARRGPSSSPPRPQLGMGPRI